MSVHRVMKIYLGSDAALTRALYNELLERGPAGELAVNVLRACKKSQRAKVYRGSHYRASSYDGKAWAMKEIGRVLAAHPELARWGWGEDDKQPHHKQVLYVDLPTGQVSFHTDARGEGPNYPFGWDGKAGLSAQRAIAYAASILSERVEV